MTCPTSYGIWTILAHAPVQHRLHGLNVGRLQRTMWQAHCQLPSFQVRETSSHHVTSPLSTALLSSSGDFTVLYGRPPVLMKYKTLLAKSGDFHTPSTPEAILRQCSLYFYSRVLLTSPYNFLWERITFCPYATSFVLFCVCVLIE